MRIHFKTFGCKVNQCETNDMIAKVQNAGCQITAMPDNADVVIINSCTVTANADRKTKQYLRRCQRLNPKAKIFLTGCYVDRAEYKLKTEFSKLKPNKCSADMPTITDTWQNHKNRTNVRVSLGLNICSNIKFFKNSDKKNIQKILGLPSLSASHLAQDKSCDYIAFNNHTRAFVKIQDGCDGKCSYCVVPKVRPKLSSENPDEIIKEVKNYVSAGHKEIVLCGIRLGKYRWRVASSEWRVVNLIKELEKIDGLYRIRLSSIELNDISDDLIEVMAKSKKLCHHLHIPLQSGDDKILKDMNRPYTTDKFFNKIEKIRKKISDIGITTDIIIGYPTDTDETLENCYEFVKKCVFSRLHIFRFSHRPGTKAALINRNCSETLVKKWQGKFGQLNVQLRRCFLKKFSDKKLEILTESNGFGYTSNYIYLKLPKKYSENQLVLY